MNDEQFHQLRRRVLQAEAHILGIAKDVTSKALQGDIPKADPGREGDKMLVGDVSAAHCNELMAFAAREGITMLDWKAHNYTNDVYGAKSAEFTRDRVRVYDAKAASRLNVVPLVSDHFELLKAPYVLNTGCAVPEGMEIPAKWARIHSGLSVEGISADLDRIADTAFAEMTAAIGQGADKAEVIEIHRQGLYELIEAKCLSVPELRVNRYLGEIYRCGMFNPLRVDEGAEEKPSYRQRLHIVGTVANFVADEFPVIKPKAA